MTRLLVLFLLVLFLLSSLPLAAQTSPATIKYDEARLHELKPHRRSIPVDGITGAFNQLHLTLTISPAGDVTHAEASGDALSEKYWPSIEGEVSQWRFTPFEQSGHPIAAHHPPRVKDRNLPHPFRLLRFLPCVHSHARPKPHPLRRPGIHSRDR
jgi:hypothetical protein